jgi:ferredoxin-NADP reductase
MRRHALAGQHVDVRLTAEDGYQAQRSYSIASAPERDRRRVWRR